MKLNITYTDDSIVLHFEGELDTPASIKAQEEIDKISAIKDKNIVVDLSQLNYIASAGLRQLLTLRKTTMANNTKLTITGVKPSVMTVLRTTNLNKIFNIE